MLSRKEPAISFESIAKVRLLPQFESIPKVGDIYIPLFFDVDAEFSVELKRNEGSVFGNGSVFCFSM